MGWLSRLFDSSGNSASAASAPPRFDVDARRSQLVDLEDALTALIRAMHAEPSPVHNPGWRGKIDDYTWVRSQVQTLLSGTITCDGVYDLILGVQPVFRGPIPDELTFIEPLQERVLASVKTMQS